MSQSNPTRAEFIPSTDVEPKPALRFPKAILSVSREEFDRLTLIVKKGLTDEPGQLPSELYGSVFIVAPVGDVASFPVTFSQGSSGQTGNLPENGGKTVLPSNNGWTSLLNGDGMVYRLDFDLNPETQACEAYLSTQLLKTPSFFADQFTNDPDPQNPYHKFQFVNIGLARVSPYIGVSDQVNTAFLPMPFPGQENPRLLATWDVGRPYEIDPASLKIIAPVGLNEEWEQIVENLPTFPFPQRMSSAHPCFDPETGEVFTANTVKSLNTLLQVFTLISHDFREWATNLPQWSIRRAIIAILAPFIVWLIDKFIVGILSFVENHFGIGKNDATYLIRWNGSGRLQKWNVTHRGHPVKIKSTMHQMGISKNYVVLTETAFKLVLEDFIPYIQQQLLKQLKKSNQKLSAKDIFDQIISWLRFHRQYLTFPQSPNTNFYIVHRDQLNRVESGGSIEAQKFTIQGECNHFLVDYDNPKEKITIHAALNKASDAAEFIHGDDTSTFPDQKPEEFAGIFSNGMAINRPAIYIVDGQSGRKEKEETLDFEQSKIYTWSIGLYAYRDDLPTREFEDIYWLGFGAWQDIQTQFIHDMYTKYIYRDRQMPLDKMMEFIQQGIPTILSRLHIDRNAKQMLSIADSYTIPGRYFANSPQFVPKKNSTGSTDGYIVCTVVYSDNWLSSNENGANNYLPWSNNSEIWIFDANNLSQGPLYRLSAPQLNFSFTVHTTWLKDRAPSPTREYNVRQDFQPLVDKASQRYPEVRQEMLDLFDKVYEAFDRDRKSS